MLRLPTGLVSPSMALAGSLLSPAPPGGLWGTLVPVGAMTALSFSAYMFNDLFDLEVDRISNPARPLPSGRLSSREVVCVASMLLVAGFMIVLVWGSLASLSMALALCAFVFVYSAPPIRLRRFFLAPYFTIATSASLSFLVAHLFWGGDPSGASITGAILVFGYGSGSCMVKEFKDIEGDSRMGVRSLPVALGLQKAVRVTIPAYLGSCLLLLPFYWLFDLSPLFLPIFGAVFLAKCKTSYDLARNPFDIGRRIRILTVEVVSTVLLFLGIAAGALV